MLSLIFARAVYILQLDYLGHTVSGRIVDLEFQKRGGEDFVKRALFCSSTIIHRQLEKGGDYGNICQTIFIALLDFSLFKDEDIWYWDFVLTHGKSGKVLTEDLALIFVEMNKVQGMLAELRRKLERGELNGEELTTRLALWGGYVTNKGVDILSEVLTKDEVFSEVLKAEHDYWGDRRNRFIQMMEEKRERDALYELAGAKRRALAEGLEQGLAEGLAEGLAKGREEGVAIGRAEGRTEGRAEGRLEGKLSTARSMLADGLPPEVVAKYSGLSVEEIASLL